MINLNQLRAFYWSARHLSFTKAAKELYVSQPAITTQIRLFEKDLQLQLFRRKRGGKLILTREGARLFEYAKKIFEYEERLEEVIEDIRKLKDRILHIGSGRSYAHYFVPSLIEYFHKDHPEIKIKVEEGNSQDLINGLIEMKNEVAIVSKVLELPDIRYELFSMKEIVPIVHISHPLLKKRFVSFHELAQEPIIMKESGSGTRWVVEDLFKRYGYVPKIIMEASDVEIIKSMVEQGNGISFLLYEAVKKDIQNKRIARLPLKGQKIYLDITIAYLKDQITFPTKAFLDCIKRIKEVSDFHV